MRLKRKATSLFGMTLLTALMALAACDSGTPQVPPTPTTGAQVSTATSTTMSSIPSATSQASVSIASPTSTAGARAIGTSTVVAPTTTLQATGTPTTVPAAASTSTSVVAPTSTTASVSQPTAESTTQATSCTKLNLNVVTEAELLSTIPGFSNRMVREFFEYRPYVSIQQFRREIGKYVDEATVANYEQYVYVPVDGNNSDAATLMQLPGVDETVAAELIAGRPYASSTAFRDALSRQLTEEQLAQVDCFLSSGE